MLKESLSSALVQRAVEDIEYHRATNQVPKSPLEPEQDLRVAFARAAKYYQDNAAGKQGADLQVIRSRTKEILERPGLRSRTRDEIIADCFWKGI